MPLEGVEVIEKRGGKKINDKLHFVLTVIIPYGELFEFTRNKISIVESAIG